MKAGTIGLQGLNAERETGHAAQPPARRPSTSSYSVVAELHELAAMATYTADARRRLALARFVTDLLLERQDGAISKAIERAQGSQIAQILRRTAESASERVVLPCNGSTVELSLFAIGIITAFDEEVPASQFEAALNGLNAPRSLSHGAEGGPRELSTMVLLPKLFRLDELQAMPLSLVRRVCGTLDRADMARAIMAPPSLGQLASCKRSAAFLRYLIGQRRKLRQHPPLNEGGVCSALRNLTQQAIERYLGLACHVDITFTDSFHDALYSGMWRYQEQRLDQLARTSRAKAPRQGRVEARVLSHGQTHPIELRVEFFAGNESIGGHGYRLSARPDEAVSECVARITRRLAAAGVAARSLTDFSSGDPVSDTRRRRTAAPSMIAIPI